MSSLNNQKRTLNSYLLISIICIGSLTSLVSCKSSKSNSTAKVGVEHLSKKKKRAINKDVILTSKKFIGTPYKYGGTTRAGMDCSGLLYTSYKMNQIDIPRSSSEQSNFGKKVSINGLKEGDWVFFATGKKRKKITHVGLVSDVKGKEDVKFIHASTSLGVMESDLFSDYWRKKFVRAIRPLR